MKIVNITYSTSGGAGIAAYRLHLSLLDEGLDSTMLCVKNKIKNAPGVVVVKTPRFSIIRRVVNKIIPIIEIIKNRKILSKIEGTYEVATFPTSDYRIHNHPLIKEANILNLHWVGDFIDYPTFFKKCKKPIVWTLHDMNPFMGCFHYKFDHYNNQLNFEALNQKLIDIKNKSYQESSIHTIVAPSKWLLNESKKSKLLGSYEHKHIYNGANAHIFKPMDMNKARKELNLPIDKIIFLFVSQDVSCFRKGFDIIEGVINGLDSENILFVAVGNPPVNHHEKIHYLGTINNADKMAQVYAASNAFILPSREDNLPNTMVEALLCGVPVISSNVGGMAEVIVDGENGYLVDEITMDAFKSQILKFIETKECFNNSIIALNAENKFSKKVLTTNYLNLYKTILNE